MKDQQWLQLLRKLVLYSPSILSEGGGVRDLATPVLSFVTEQLGATFAECWSVNPRDRVLVHVAEEPRNLAPTVPRLPTLPFGTSMTGLAVQSKRLRCFDLDKPQPPPFQIANPELIDALDVRHMISIPIPTTGNPHQALCVFNFYFPDGTFLLEEPSTFEFAANRTTEPFVHLMAAGIEAALRERGLRCSLDLTSTLSEDLSRRVSPNPLAATRQAYNALIDNMRNAVDADFADIYVLDKLENLNRHASTSSAKSARQIASREIEHTLLSNREQVTTTLIENGTFRSQILLPIHSHEGKPHGVILLSRKASQRDPNAKYFTYDDIAILEAILQGFVPTLATIQANESQRFAMQKLTHELRVPIQTFGAILEGMKEECEQKGFTFHYPHFSEAEIYCDLMSRLIREMNLMRLGASAMPLVSRPIKLWSDIIMPLRRFLTPLLRAYGFRRSQISDEGIEHAPQIDVDPGLITQILFNLVDNALKYYTGDPRQFYCLLRGRMDFQSFQISVISNGPEISETDAKHIFDYEWRGDARSSDTPGEGIGLSISKAVAERHGGTLRLASRMTPTEFVLTIPSERVLLQQRPSRKL